MIASLLRFGAATTSFPSPPDVPEPPRADGGRHGDARGVRGVRPSHARRRTFPNRTFARAFDTTDGTRRSRARTMRSRRTSELPCRPRAGARDLRGHGYRHAARAMATHRSRARGRPARRLIRGTESRRATDRAEVQDGDGAQRRARDSRRRTTGSSSAIATKWSAPCGGFSRCREGWRDARSARNIRRAGK